MPLQMTEAKFTQWSSIERRGEWIDGSVVVLEDVLLAHAELHGFLLQLLYRIVEEHNLGKIWCMPFQLRLASQRRRRLPDLFFAATAKLKFLHWTEFDGSPDLIIEIVSADSQSRDRREKFLEYEKAGVTEYWLVDSVSRTFEMFNMDPDGKYQRAPVVGPRTYSGVIPGLFFHDDWLLDVQKPKVSTLLLQMNRLRKKRSSTRRG